MCLGEIEAKVGKLELAAGRSAKRCRKGRLKKEASPVIYYGDRASYDYSDTLVKFRVLLLE